MKLKSCSTIYAAAGISLSLCRVALCSDHALSNLSRVLVRFSLPPCLLIRKAFDPSLFFWGSSLLFRVAPRPSDWRSANAHRMVFCCPFMSAYQSPRKTVLSRLNPQAHLSVPPCSSSPFRARGVERTHRAISTNRLVAGLLQCTLSSN